MQVEAPELAGVSSPEPQPGDTLPGFGDTRERGALRAGDFGASKAVSAQGLVGPSIPDMAPAPGAVDLLWLPLGAGGHVVRWNGKVYEAIKALIERRPRFALYHTALEVGLPDGWVVIESAPIRDDRGRRERGVVAEGPVGTRWLGHFRLFRYEIRRWSGGSIPDASEAVSSPVRVVSDLAVAQRIVDLVPTVPTPTWGRDELRTGDMWNSNSLISWLLERAGLVTDPLQPPSGGRAPGWDAGVIVARRQMRREHQR